MNRQFRSALLVLCAATLGGCGLKGPLYFPLRSRHRRRKGAGRL
ncbi:lipoprotein [Edwardsiella anguillarum]|nr:lipoprotein [Edwardsiella anguillarum]